MHAVVLQHVGQVIGFEQVIDADDLDVVEVLHRCTQHHAADAAKSVDADFDGHGGLSFVGGGGGDPTETGRPDM